MGCVMNMREDGEETKLLVMVAARSNERKLEK